jgi:ABC-2 type transport system permease protein
MRDILHAEWTKLRTVAGPAWLVAAVAGLTVALSALAAAAMACPAVGCDADAVQTSLTGVQLGQAIIAMLAVGVVAGEYSTGMIRTTLMAQPRRAAVLAAKTAVVTVLVLLAALVGVLGSLIAGHLLLPPGLPLSLTTHSTVRAGLGSVLYCGLIGWLSLGVGAMVRNAAAGVGVVLGLLYLSPIVVHVIGDEKWQHRVERYSPGTAGLAIQATTNLGTRPIGPWAGLGVLAVWAVAALLLGGLALRWRDA